MSDSFAEHPPRLPRWTFLALLVIAAAGLWSLDTHRPLPWPEAATAWFAHARALAPAPRLVDAVNGVALTPDLPLGSVVLVLAVGVLVLAALRDAAVAWPLALTAAVGVLATRSVWSTAATGIDAAPVAGVALLLVALARRGRQLGAWFALLALLFIAPWLTWPALAVAVVHAHGWRVRGAVLGLGIVAAVAMPAVLAWWAARSVACADASLWREAFGQVLLPGASAQASSWSAVRQAAAVLMGDVHPYGIALAIFGTVTAAPVHAHVRHAAVAWLVGVLVAVTAGALPPAAGAATLLPWWAVLSARGAVALVAWVPSRQRRLASAFVVAAAVALPLLRHATVVPGPWVQGHPAITRAASSSMAGTWLASQDTIEARRWRSAGMTTLPADPLTLRACLAQGARVATLGDTARHVEERGFQIEKRPLHVPLAAVVADLRRDQLTALAMAAPALPYLGPAGLASLGRYGIARNAVPVTASLVTLARTDVGGRVEVARGGCEIAAGPGEAIGGRQLVDPVTVHAHADRAGVDSRPHQLATSTTAALAVFDRTQAVVLRSAAVREAGLPISLGTLAGWQPFLVSGSPACAEGADEWLALTSASRVGVPLAGTSHRRPLVAYVASAQRPRPAVAGVALHSARAEWATRVFDLAMPGDVAALTEVADQDGIGAVAARPSRWWTRMEVRPRDPWHAPSATLLVGVEGDWWVRPAGARSAPSRRLCRLVASGERLLLGQYGAVDDDSARELDVWAGVGWHASERQGASVHQWSAQPTAAVGFHLATPADLELALDAMPGAGALAVAVNGAIVDADWQGAGRIAIAARLLRQGENVLTLSVPAVVRPARDPRPLGVLVRQLRLLRGP